MAGLIGQFYKCDRPHLMKIIYKFLFFSPLNILFLFVCKIVQKFSSVIQVQI